MIKKYLSIIFIFLFLFFLNSGFVIGQNSTNSANIEYIFNCGFANTQYNKCCNSISETYRKWELSDIPLIGNLLNNFQDKLINSFEEKMQNTGFDFITDKCKTGKEVVVNGQCICQDNENSIENTSTKKYQKLCEKLFKEGKQKEQCMSCVNKDMYYSAIGCIPVDLSKFISEFLLGRLIGLAGIFAFFCIIYAAFIMQSSQGNQEKLKKAQELLTSCIMGLIFIIFSVFILKLIGIDILRLPGFK
ncbi:MAG: hypothetical protein Fur009_4090 [Candidatus Microgenomates bacterium]